MLLPFLPSPTETVLFGHGTHCIVLSRCDTLCAVLFESGTRCTVLSKHGTHCGGEVAVLNRSWGDPSTPSCPASDLWLRFAGTVPAVQERWPLLPTTESVVSVWPTTPELEVGVVWLLWEGAEGVSFVFPFSCHLPLTAQWEGACLACGNSGLHL